jgi:hypothetical protein
LEVNSIIIMKKQVSGRKRSEVVTPTKVTPSKTAVKAKQTGSVTATATSKVQRQASVDEDQVVEIQPSQAKDSQRDENMSGDEEGEEEFEEEQQEEEEDDEDVS